MENWIDICVTALNKRDIEIMNERFDNTKITGNRTIMDYTIDYVDHIKLKNI